MSVRKGTDATDRVASRAYNAEALRPALLRSGFGTCRSAFSMAGVSTPSMGSLRNLSVLALTTPSQHSASN
jgi:hypothetical protein